MSISQHDIELETLQLLQQADSGSPKQRDLARILGISLGMTNAIVKRLVEKGFLMLRKINGRNMQYAVTPEGSREIARRSYRYMRRTIGNVSRWKEAIDSVIRQEKEAGISRIELIGESDLAFMVEYSCRRHQLDFALQHAPASGKDELPLNHTKIIMSESFDPDNEETEAGMSDCLFLRRIIHSTK